MFELHVEIHVYETGIASNRISEWYGEYVLWFSINRSSLPENLISMKLIIILFNLKYCSMIYW